MPYPHVLMSRLLGALCLAALTSGCASSVIQNPGWTQIPSPYEMGDVYPEFATQIDMEGGATLRCAAVTEGRLADCRVLKAWPRGLGFDRAALALTPRFLIQPRLVDGEARRARVQFTVHFSLGPPPAPPAHWAGAEPTPEALALARTVVARWPGRPTPVPASLDVDADRQRWVASVIAQVDRDLDAGMREVAALGLARLHSREMLEMLTVGQRRPPESSDPARQQSANDRLIALENLRAARLRQAYRDRYGRSTLVSLPIPPRWLSRPGHRRPGCAARKASRRRP